MRRNGSAIDAQLDTQIRNQISTASVAIYHMAPYDGKDPSDLIDRYVDIALLAL